MTRRSCPIWGHPWQCHQESRTIHSPRAGGTYFPMGDIWDGIGPLLLDNVVHKINLSRWIYEINIQGGDALIDLEIIQSVKAKPLPSVPERMDALLQFIELKTREQISNPIARSPEMLAATSVASEEDFSRLLYLMQKNDWIGYGHGRVNYPYSNDTQNLETNIRLMPAGYQRVEILRNVQADSSQAFVAMWFDSSLDDAWNHGFEKGIEDAGYQPMRIDRKEHNNKIDDEIIAEIRRSRFLVADFTSESDKPRGGVYYEAGFAHGLNIPVIFTCHESRINDLHFDTRQFNHIAWATPAELRTKLKHRISATIGDGPLTPPRRD